MDLHSRDVKQDVRELGALLGDVLAEQTSEGAFETVEDIRTTAIDYRKGEQESRQELDRILDALSPEGESVVARAFTTYFELINLAEERERARAVREGSQSGDLEDGLVATVESLIDADADGLLPDETVIVAIVRNDELHIPRGESDIQVGDTVTIFATDGASDRITGAFTRS